MPSFIYAVSANNGSTRAYQCNILFPAVRCAESQVGMPEGSLPPTLTPELLEDASFVKALHRVLMDMHVVEGALICPETGRRFPITEGVPNLM